MAEEELWIAQHLLSMRQYKVEIKAISKDKLPLKELQVTVKTKPSLSRFVLMLVLIVIIQFSVITLHYNCKYIKVNKCERLCLRS